MSYSDLKGYVFALRPQLIVICIILFLQILSIITSIPAPSELAIHMIKLLSTHGLPLIMLASFIENFAGLGTYFPGSIAIVSAMALTAGDPARAGLTYVAIVVPAAIANIASYLIGYWTRSEESSAYPPRSTKALLMWYSATYWHPQLGTVSAMASGGEGIRFGRYLSHFLPVALAWSIFWALLLYNSGKVVSGLEFFAPLFYCYLIIWLLWGIRKHYILTSRTNV